MSASDDFKATVNAAVSQGGPTTMPDRGEVVLLGQKDRGELVRVRVPRGLRWFDALIARSFVRSRAIDRLAVIVLEKDSADSPRSFRIGLTDRSDPEGPDFVNPTVTKVIRAVRSEWSGALPPLTMVAGRPWPITLLAVALFLDLILGAERLAWTLAGFYQWMPLVPALPSALLHIGYLVLVAVTIRQLWRRGRTGYVLGILLALVQIVRAAALAVPEYRALSGADFALWLTEALLFPVLIAVCFFVLYQARNPTSVSAGRRGSPGTK